MMRIDLLFLVLISINLYSLVTLNRIRKGNRHMADAQAQALADLTAAVQDMADVVANAAAALSNVQPDDSAAIEAQVSKLKDAAAVMKAALNPAPVETAPVEQPAPEQPAPDAPAAS